MHYLGTQPRSEQRCIHDWHRAVGVGDVEREHWFISCGSGGGQRSTVPNTPAGVDVVPNTLPFINGPGPGLQGSCPGETDESIPGEVLVVVGWSDS